MMKLTALLDANVLYMAGLRDLLIRLALQDLYHLKWSDRIHEEWMRNLLANRSDLTWEKLDRTRQLMMRAVPDSLVSNYESLIETVVLPDPDDRHVLAAAMFAKTNLIITFNLVDFPASVLTPFGLEAWSPDRFILYLLELNPEGVCVAAKQHRGALKNPTKTVEEYLAERQKDGLVATVAQLREYAAMI
jgi:predicted nucleic acid-binding protein